MAKNRMKSRFEPPQHFTSPDPKSLYVMPTRNPTNPADSEATEALLKFYSDDDGFCCPICHVRIADHDKAVIHLGQEINKALARLAQKAVK